MQHVFQGLHTAVSVLADGPPGREREHEDHVRLWDSSYVPGLHVRVERQLNLLCGRFSLGVLATVAMVICVLKDRKEEMPAS